MQGETVASSGCANTAVAQPAGDYLSGAAIDAFTNLATATADYRGVVESLTQANRF
jgi:hypothetical protein